MADIAPGERVQLKSDRKRIGNFFFWLTVYFVLMFAIGACLRWNKQPSPAFTLSLIVIWLVIGIPASWKAAVKKYLTTKA